MISITPIHRQRTPAMEIPSSMAEAAPSSAADASSPWLPIARAQSRESAVIPVQITVIAMVSPPRCPPSAPVVLVPPYVFFGKIIPFLIFLFFPGNDKFRLTSFHILL